MSEKLNKLSHAGRLKFLAKDAVFYGGLAALSRFSSLITFPFLTRLLDKEAFAILDLFLVIETLFIFLCIMGQDSALGRFFYDDDNNEDRKSVCTSSLVIQTGFLSITLLGMLIFKESILNFYGIPEKYEPLMWILAFKIFLTIPLNYSINLMKWSFMRKGFAFITLGSSVGIMLSAIVGALYFSSPLKGILILQSICLIFFSSWGLFLCRGWLGRISKKSCFPSLIFFGLPFGLIALSSNLVPSIDRSMVSNYLGIEALAIYAVANRVANLFRIGATAFQNAWGPFYMSSYKLENAEETFSIILRFYCLGVSIVFIVFNYAADWFVPFLAGEQYSDASKISVYLAFGILIQSVGWITGIGSILAKRPLFDLATYIIQLAVTVVSIYTLLPMFGLLGVAYSVLIGLIFQAASMTIFGYFCYPFRFNITKPIITLTYSFIFVLFQSFYIDKIDIAHQTLMLLFSIGLMVLYIVERKEWSQFKNSITKQ